MDFAFIRDRRAAEQLFVAIKDSYFKPSLCQSQCYAASLKTPT
jgi:hypothetical protein